MTKPVPQESAMLTSRKLAALLICLLLWCGCGKPPMLIKKYLLEYPPPVVKVTPVEENLKVEKFAVAQAFNTTAMVYRSDPYKSDTYNYSRWQVNPGYLITDYLIRDLRNSRIFKAVLPTDSPTKARFLLEGGVEKIEEIDQPDAWKASLVLNITLLDTSHDEITKRVLFQKNYQAAEPLTEKTPGGLAQGMSRALEQLSAQIIADVGKAAKNVSSKQ